VVKSTENAGTRGLHEVSSDNFTGVAVVDAKEAGSGIVVNEKEDRSATAFDEKEDGRVAEEVVVAHICRLEEVVVPLNKSIVGLLQSDGLDHAAGIA
jgi:hypothetical protein